MKNLRNTAMLVLLSAGCTFAQKITVQGERKLNTDFKKYKTFGWMKDSRQGNQVVEYTYAEMIDPSDASMDSKQDRKMEKKEEKKMMKDDKTMTKQDKKMMKNSKGNDVVIYSYSFILPSQDSVINNSAINSVDEELEGRGYKMDNVSPDLLVAYKIFDARTQIKGYNNDSPQMAGREELRSPQDTVTYALKPGTVFITLVDAKTSTVVWEGFASGVAKNNDAINDPMKVKEAINLIFKKFEFRADKYSMNN